MACDEHRNDLACTPIIPDSKHIQTMFSKAATLKIAEFVGVKSPKVVMSLRLKVMFWSRWN